MEAFDHFARARVFRINQYHCIVIPVLNAILQASSSAIRLCKAKIVLLKVIHNLHIVGGEKVFPLAFSVNLYLRVGGVTLRPWKHNLTCVHF